MGSLPFKNPDEAESRHVILVLTGGFFLKPTKS
jgi:hypothetical protein